MKLTDEDRYPYPDEVYEDYTEELKAIAIRKGDVIMGVEVGSAKHGIKWTELRKGSGQLIERCPVDKLFEVTRTRETKESRDAQNRASKNRALCKTVNKWERETPAAFEKAAAKCAEWGTLRDEHLTAIAYADANDRVWGGFMAVIEHHERLAEQGEFDGDIVDVLAVYRDHLRDQICADYRHRGNSRSTNQMSNLMEDILLETQAEFLNRPHYWF